MDSSRMWSERVFSDARTEALRSLGPTSAFYTPGVPSDGGRPSTTGADTGTTASASTAHTDHLAKKLEGRFLPGTPGGDCADGLTKTTYSYETRLDEQGCWVDTFSTDWTCRNGAWSVSNVWHENSAPAPDSACGKGVLEEIRDWF